MSAETRLRLRLASPIFSAGVLERGRQVKALCFASTLWAARSKRAALTDLTLRSCLLPARKKMFQFSPFLTIPLQLSIVQSLEGGLLVLDHRIVFLLFRLAKLGSVGDYETSSPAGRAGPFARPTRHQTMDRSNRSQTCGRARRHQVGCDHSCRARLP